MAKETTRNLLERFLGQWEQFQKRYEEDRKELQNITKQVHENSTVISALEEFKEIIKKVNANTTNITVLEEFKNSHIRSHTLFVRIAILLFGGGVLFKLIDWFVTVVTGWKG